MCLNYTIGNIVVLYNNPQLWSINFKITITLEVDPLEKNIKAIVLALCEEVKWTHWERISECSFWPIGREIKMFAHSLWHIGREYQSLSKLESNLSFGGPLSRYLHTHTKYISPQIQDGTHWIWMLEMSHTRKVQDTDIKGPVAQWYIIHNRVLDSIPSGSML